MGKELTEDNTSWQNLIPLETFGENERSIMRLRKVQEIFSKGGMESKYDYELRLKWLTEDERRPDGKRKRSECGCDDNKRMGDRNKNAEIQENKEKVKKLAREIKCLRPTRLINHILELTLFSAISLLL